MYTKDNIPVLFFSDRMMNDLEKSIEILREVGMNFITE